MASDKRRQQRKAAKQQRREARKRETSGGKGEGRVLAPTELPKLSDTLSCFAGPLIELADEVDPPLLRQLLVMAAGVWNAQLAPFPSGAILPPTDSDAATLALRLGVPVGHVRTALARLPAWKRSNFRADKRAFTEVETRWGEGEIRVRVLGYGQLGQVARESLPVHYQGHAVDQLVAELLQSDLANAACEQLAIAVAGVPDRALLASSLIVAYVKAAQRPDPARLWRFAAAVSYIAGPEAAREGYKRAAQLGNAASATVWGALATAFDLDFVHALPPESPEGLTQVARSLVEKGAPGLPRVLDALAALALLPAGRAEALAGALLSALADHGDASVLAAWGALAPLAPPVRDLFMQYLATSAGKEGRTMLSRMADVGLDDEASEGALTRLGSEPVAGRRHPSLPSDWFVSSALAGLPDRYGCRMVWIERLGPGGNTSVFGGLVSDRRGLVEVVGVVDGKDALTAAMDEAPDDCTVWPVDLAYATAVLGDGVALASSRQFPLPVTYRQYGALVAGLGEGSAPDIAAVADDLYDPELLCHTGALWHHSDFAGRNGLIGDSAAARALDEEIDALGRALAEVPDGVPVAFPKRIARELDATFDWPVDAAGLAAIDEAARPHLAEVFAEDRRACWRDRLHHVAYVYECGGLRALAELAATAAWALGPDGGTPLDEQPFIRDMIRMAAVFE